MKKQKKQPQLESQNLILYPLLPEQMNLLRDDPNELCRSLSLVPDDYAKYGEWVMLAEEQYRKMMADQEYMSFYTLWIITEKEDKHLVGYLYFLGRPSDTEAVELNGFIKPAYRRKGYMTEALNTLRGWAFANKSVTIMLAHPQRDDEIFHGLLRKSGFGHWVEHEHEKTLTTAVRKVINHAAAIWTHHKIIIHLCSEIVLYIVYPDSVNLWHRSSLLSIKSA